MKCHLIYVILGTIFLGSVVALPKECKGGLPGYGCRHLCGYIFDECPKGYNRGYHASFGSGVVQAGHAYTCVCERPWNAAETKEIEDYVCDNSAHTCATDTGTTKATHGIGCGLANDRCTTERLNQWCVNRTKDFPKDVGTARICRVLEKRLSEENAPCDTNATECAALWAGATTEQMLEYIDPDDRNDHYPKSADREKFNEMEKSNFEKRVRQDYLLMAEDACNDTVTTCDNVRLEEKCGYTKKERGPNDEGTKRICHAYEQRIEFEKAKRRERADNAGTTGCPYNARECIRGVGSLSRDYSCEGAASCSEDDLIFWCKFAKDNITGNPAGVKKICDVLAQKQRDNDPNKPCNEYVEQNCEHFNVPDPGAVDENGEITPDGINEAKKNLAEECGAVAKFCKKERLEYWCKTMTRQYPKGLATEHICKAAGIHVAKGLQKPAAETKATAARKGRVAPKGRVAQNQKKGRGLGPKCTKGAKCSADKKVGEGVIDSLKDGLIPDVDLKDVTGTRI